MCEVNSEFRAGVSLSDRDFKYVMSISNRFRGIATTSVLDEFRVEGGEFLQDITYPINV